MKKRDHWLEELEKTPEQRDHDKHERRSEMIRHELRKERREHEYEEEHGRFSSDDEKSAVNQKIVDAYEKKQLYLRRNARYEERMARHVAKQAEKAMGTKVLNDIEGSKEDFIEGSLTGTDGANGGTSASPAGQARAGPADGGGGNGGSGIAGAVAAVSSSPSASDPLQPGSGEFMPAAPADVPQRTEDEAETKKPSSHCWLFIWCRTY